MRYIALHPQAPTPGTRHRRGAGETIILLALALCRAALRCAVQAVDHAERKKANPNPKWPVPYELIEWQPVYHQRGAVGEQPGGDALRRE